MGDMRGRNRRGGEGKRRVEAKERIHRERNAPGTNGRKTVLGIYQMAKLWHLLYPLCVFLHIFLASSIFLLFFFFLFLLLS